MHCGSIFGLTPPDWSAKNSPHYKHQNEAWRAYEKIVQQWVNPDILLVNGDCIEGRQDKQGGAELITNDRNVQCEMAIKAIELWHAKKILMTYGCLTAGHRILTEDLRWVPVETLKSGDNLIGFEEEPNGNLKRKWLKTKVITNIPFIADVYRIKLSDGTFLEATGEHPFLVKTPSRKYQWKTVEHLCKSIKKNGREWIHFNRILPMWEENKSYESGYLSGFFDGEGCLTQALKENRSGHEERTLSITATQKDNIVLEEAKRILNKLDFKFSTYNKYKEDSSLFNLQLKGGISGLLKFLGIVRPKRLLKKFDVSKLGSIRTSYKEKTKIIGIELIGKKEVWGLSTNSKTYISEGFLSHNTSYHTGSQAEDFEYNIAKEVGAEIGGRLFFKVEGMTIDARHKIGSSIIPHGRATAIMRDMVWNLIKSVEGDEPRADIIIRSHAHYHIWIEQVNRVMFITPALQLSRGRYGSRECVGETHWGAIRLRLNKGQIVGKDISIWNLKGSRPKVIRIK